MLPIRKMISNGYDAGEGAEIGSVWQTDPISAPTCNHIRKEDDSRNRIRTTSWSSLYKCDC